MASAYFGSTYKKSLIQIYVEQTYFTTSVAVAENTKKGEINRRLHASNGQKWEERALDTFLPFLLLWTARSREPTSGATGGLYAVLEHD